jgi:hypothetical protein
MTSRTENAGSDQLAPGSDQLAPGSDQTMPDGDQFVRQHAQVVQPDDDAPAPDDRVIVPGEVVPDDDQVIVPDGQLARDDDLVIMPDDEELTDDELSDDEDLAYDNQVVLSPAATSLGGPATASDFAAPAQAPAPASAPAPAPAPAPGLAPASAPVPVADRTSLGVRWHEIQAMFVDDPRTSVELAAGMLDDSTEVLIGSLRERQQALLSAWQGTDADTEDLRTALQQYRAFWNRLEDFSQ